MKANNQGTSHAAPRLREPQASPAAWAGMMALQQAVNKLGQDPQLMDLVKLRASQINRCAFCIDLHVRDALARGERPERLHLLNAWEEVEVFTAKERAALRWTEALTRLSEGTVSDAVYAEVREQFSEAELLELTLTIVTINGWNRFNVGFRVPPQATEYFKVSKRPAAHPADAAAQRNGEAVPA